MTKRIAVYCCNALFGEGVKCLLKEMSDWVVIHCTQPEAIAEVQPQLVIADLISIKKLPLDALFEQGAMLLLLETGKMEKPDQDYLLSLTSKGLVGILAPTTDTFNFQKAIRSVSAGELWMERKTVRDLLSSFGNRSEEGETSLTEREKEIAKLVCKGYRNKEIMHLLHISEQSVKSHLHRIFRKTGVPDRLKLALYFTQHYPEELSNRAFAETEF